VPQVHIRPAEVSDAAALMGIYNPVVQTSTATFDLTPRTLADQQAWLADRSGARIVLVAVAAADELPSGETPPVPAGGVDASDGETIAGFAALSPYRDRAAYSTTVEDSVYVDPRFQRSGVGRLLLARLVETARAHGFHSVIARIVSDHEASIALHASCGFEVVGHEREVGRKFGRWLDVTVMQRLL
jgi:L-amino acid N-acyltransferase